jgi:hypothetical protein
MTEPALATTHFPHHPTLLLRQQQFIRIRLCWWNTEVLLAS